MLYLDKGFIISRMALSQPAWAEVNKAQSFMYTREEVEEKVQLYNPGFVHSNEDNLKKEFYSHHDEPSLNFVSFKIDVRYLS